MIPVVEIIRLEEDFTYGTFGVLKVNKEVFCVTLELPDKENQQNVSSIPVQQYLAKRYMSSRHGETFIVENVPGRSAILFHSGNTTANTAGCILLAQYFGKLRTGERAVLNSGETFNKFMDLFRGHEKFHLTIKEVY